MAYNMYSDNFLSKLPFEIQDKISNYVDQLIIKDNFEECLIELKSEIYNDIPSAWIKESQYSLYMKKYTEFLDICNKFIINNENLTIQMIKYIIYQWIYNRYAKSSDKTVINANSNNLIEQGQTILINFHTSQRMFASIRMTNTEDQRIIYFNNFLKRFLIELNYQELLSLKQFLINKANIIMERG